MHLISLDCQVATLYLTCPDKGKRMNEVEANIGELFIHYYYFLNHDNKGKLQPMLQCLNVLKHDASSVSELKSF